MRYTDEFLDQLQQKGDPSIDGIIPEMMEQRQLQEINDILRKFVVNTTDVPEGVPQKLAQWMTTHSQFPAWADRARVIRAADFQVDHAFAIYTILAIVSLLQIYADEHSARNLQRTDRLGYSGAARRLGETTQFMTGIITPGAWNPEGGAIPIIVKVRLMHAASRFLIGEMDWDHQRYGLPANQEELLMVLMTFARTPIKYMPKLGYTPTRQEEDDMLYFWQVVGELLGIPRNIIPDTVEEADELQQATFRRGRRKSPEGLELSGALMKALPAMFGPSAKLFSGLVPAFVYWLAGDELCSVLDIPRSRWEFLLKGSKVVGRMFNSVQNRSTTINNLVNKIGMGMLTYRGRALTGGQSQFKIPTELRRAWRLPPLGSAEKVAALMPKMIQSVREKAGENHWKDTLTGIAVLVANADGEIDDLEILVLTEMLKVLGTESDIQTLLETQVKRLDKEKPETLNHRLIQELKQWGGIEDGLALACAVAYANSGIAPEERTVIEALAKAAGIRGDALAEIVDRTRLEIEAA